MPRSYFPENDNELKLWLANFVAMLEVNKEMVGLLEADVTAITSDSNEFTAALEGYQSQLIMTASASGAKKMRRTAAIARLRPLVQRIQNHPGMNDQLRGLLGLPLRGGVVQGTVGMPMDVPGIALETEPGSVVVHFGTEPSNERLNGKPSGVKGCNVWRSKAGEESYQLVGYQAASPFVDTIEGVGCDYTYVVQYRGNKASDLGQMSAPSTIAARGGLVQAA